MKPTTSTKSMQARARKLLRRLIAVEPLEVPAGERGVILRDPQTGQTHHCIPVLSVYLDLRPVAAQGGGQRPAVRPGRLVLTERLRQIERTFWPRGAAFAALHADAVRLGDYLATQVDVATPGIAIFASGPHGLFETFPVDIPLATQVTARALPDLFQLARVFGEQETAIVALVHTNSARLFVSQRGGLHEVRGLVDDPKRYHLVHGANAMNQAHYQRHAIMLQAAFAHEVAEHIARLVDEQRATDVVLAGEARGLGLLRQALAPRVVALVRELPHSLEPEALPNAIWEDVALLLAEVEAERDHALVERLVEAVRAEALGVVGLAPTRRALHHGQVDVLVLAKEGPLAPETRDELIAEAIKTDATIQVVESSEALEQMGGIGALLRYRVPKDEATPPVIQ